MRVHIGNFEPALPLIRSTPEIVTGHLTILETTRSMFAVVPELDTIDYLQI